MDAIIACNAKESLEPTTGQSVRHEAFGTFVGVLERIAGCKKNYGEGRTSERMVLPGRKRPRETRARDV